MSSSKHAFSVILRSILGQGAVIYTVFVLLLAFLQGEAIASTSLRFLLLFSLCFSAANYIHKTKKISAFLKFLLHFLLTIGGLFLFVILPTPYEGNSDSHYFIVLIFFVLIYLLVYGLIALFRSRWKKEIRRDSVYKPQFSDRAESVHAEMPKRKH